MHIAFLNPQGNFDRADSHWAAHPDFGGQLVYVKQVAVAMAARGHRVDILTRRVVDPAWPEFAAKIDDYAGVDGVRIVRVGAGDDDRFLAKEELWPYLGRDWVPNIITFYRREGSFPQAATAHYGDGGIAAVLLETETGIPFTFTAHSLGAQKMDKMGVTADNVAEIDARYHFARRLTAERLSMNHSGVNVTSTRQERYEQYGHRAYRGAVDPDDGEAFAVIPPGVNLAVFGADVAGADEATVAGRVAARLDRDLAPGRAGLPAVVASSRLDPKKNLLGLVEAFAVSPELQASANLVIVTGALEDPLRDVSRASPAERAVIDSLRAVIDRAGLAGSVSLFGILGQGKLAAAYRYLAGRRSVFALTAHYEPFGLAPLEAAAAGLPVVVTANGGPSESLRDDDGEYGVLVDPADPDAIAAGLLRALGPEWDELAVRGRQRVLDRYTWDRTAGGYLDALDRMLVRSRPGRASLPVPPYFTDPSPATDIPTAVLHDLYLEP